MEILQVPAVVDPSSYLLTVVLAILICLAAHQIVQRLVNTMDWPEALKIKE